MSESKLMDEIQEAIGLIKSIAPKEAPKDLGGIIRIGGLRVIVNDYLPDDTIVVSPRLFDAIYESSVKPGETT